MRDRKDIESELSPQTIEYENEYHNHEEPLEEYLKRVLQIQIEILLDIREVVLENKK